MTGYEDIIHLPHHVSARHPQMSRENRAAQFAPFAALTGYGDVIRESARFTEGRPELTEEEKEELDYKLRALGSMPGEKPQVRLTYFVPDQRKDGGLSRTVCGRIRKVDAQGKWILLDDGTKVDVDCVVDLKW